MLTLRPRSPREGRLQRTPEIAFPQADVDENYLSLQKGCSSRKKKTGACAQDFGTHDLALIRRLRICSAEQIKKADFEVADLTEFSARARTLPARLHFDPWGGLRKAIGIVVRTAAGGASANLWFMRAPNVFARVRIQTRSSSRIGFCHQ